MHIFSETTPELVSHALLIRDVLLSKTRELLELSFVLIHRHVALLEIAELLTLTLNNTFWNVLRFEVTAEIIPGNHTTSSGIFVLLEPFSSLILELKRGKLDKVLRSDIATFEVLVDVHEPIIGVCGLHTVVESLWLICKELIEGSKMRLLVALALISLITLPLVAILQELNQNLSVGIGGCHQGLPCLRRRRWWRRVSLTSFIAFRILTRWRSHPEERVTSVSILKEIYSS